MAVSSGEECQNVRTFVVGLPDAGTTNVQYELVPNVCYVKVPSLMESKMYLHPESNLQNHNQPKSDKVNNYALCDLNVDIEKGKEEIAESTEESTGHLKSDDSLARAFQVCLQLGGRFTQFLMNQNPDLPKVTSKDKFLGERVCDMPITKSRKYKRSTSFNSRRVVLLFSFMSSLGTIILIYLTLRVRQISDGYGNV